VSALLSVDRESSKSLAAFIYNHSDGTFLNVVEYTNMLMKEGFVQYKNGQLLWDIAEVMVELDGATDLILRKISRLSEQSQELLKIASCLGSTLDDRLLMHFATDPVLHAFRKEGEKLGLIVFDRKNGLLQFAHGRINEAVYETIMSAAEREALHRRIGKQLWRNFDMATLDRRIFVVVGQLMAAQNAMTDQKERHAVAKLCLCAGEKAVFLRSNFYTSYVYLMHGINLLDSRSWRDEYDLCLELHNAAAEVAFSCGQVVVFELVTAILENARTLGDTVRGRTIEIYAPGSSGKLQEATKMTLDFLRLLGEPFPLRPNAFHAWFALRRIRRTLKTKTNGFILRLPVMEDEEKIAAMQVLNLSFMYAFSTGGKVIGVMMADRILDLTLRFGLTPVSCVGFAVCAAGLW